MPAEIRIETNRGYLLVTVTGEAVRPKEAEAILIDLGERATAAASHLIVHRPVEVDQKISSMDLYHLAGVLESLDFKYKIALAFPQAQHENLIFFEGEAKRRGIDVKLFSDLGSAERWVREGDDG